MKFHGACNWPNADGSFHCARPAGHDPDGKHWGTGGAPVWFDDDPTANLNDGDYDEGSQRKARDLGWTDDAPDTADIEAMLIEAWRGAQADATMAKKQIDTLTVIWQDAQEAADAYLDRLMKLGPPRAPLDDTRIMKS